MSEFIKNKTNSISKKAVKRTAIIVFLVVTVVSTVIISAYNYSKASALKQSTLNASAECSDVQDDIAEKSALIEGEGFDEYCEKIAREKYGYARPGEFVIYDSSFGK